MYNKKGQMTIMMTIMLVGLLFALIMLLAGGIAVTKINDALDLDINAGQVNIKNETDRTWGKFADMYITHSDWWGISLIFGMVLGLFISAYFLRDRFPKWGIILDIFIIIVIFIVALYLSSSYSTLLDALADAGETYLEDSVAKTSNFMVNLHIYVVIIGVIMMILFHSSIPKRTEERIQQGGFLQGVQ